MKRAVTILMFSLLAAGMAFGQLNTNIPRSKVIRKIKGKSYYIHTVEKNQSLYMIAKTYGVDVDDIIRENPEVKEGIRIKQELKVPIPGKTEKQEIRKELPKEKPSEKTEVAPAEEIILPCGQDTKGKKPVYTIALMLPLYLDSVDEIDSANTNEGNDQDIKSFEFLPFYEGFRMAVDSMVAKGFSVKLLVYDVREDTVPTRKILRSEEFRDVDLIIGLLFSKNFRMVSAYALKNKIPIVNPVSERDEITRHNPEVIKVKPGLNSQPGMLVSLLKKNFPGYNMIVIKDPDFKSRQTVDDFLSRCEKMKIPVHLTDGYVNAVPLLVKDTVNLLLVFSEDKVKVIDWITKFNVIRSEFAMTLVGLPRWDLLDEDIESDYLVNLKTYIFSPTFIDYDDEPTRQFVRSYQEIYKTDPDVLAFQGYDVAVYFMTALSRYGRNFERCLPEFNMNGLRSDFEFSKPGEDGMENSQWKIYMYDNYRLKAIRPE